ncbi:hypothetical protein HBI56_231790 [Parastagonospora nodorum]|nr:hypothetical protein HBH50_214780 [Parastagonospora nodorum]KAH4080955.1 hypothetical protein HBH48_204210 [Parastagonospora nodorum]KAH5054957.1 hypothetical protein HBI73_223410 [Parastagonospora nodorum]KAH5750230.1 hypothetical protein HBI97_240330 [Parastagonospora nodorum]KAH5786136.1 hypothetical protein HBI96_234120 [Parastagonospora nodorum]
MATSRYTSTLLSTISNILGPEVTQVYMTDIIYALRYPDVCGNRADEFMHHLRSFPAAAIIHNEIARITHDPDSDLNLPRVEADDACLRHSLYMVRFICRGMPDNVHDVRWQVLGFADQRTWQSRMWEQMRMQQMAQVWPAQQNRMVIMEDIYGDERYEMFREFDESEYDEADLIRDAEVVYEV